MTKWGVGVKDGWLNNLGIKVNFLRHVGGLKEVHVNNHIYQVQIDSNILNNLEGSHLKSSQLRTYQKSF